MLNGSFKKNIKSLTEGFQKYAWDKKRFRDLVI